MVLKVEFSIVGVDDAVVWGSLVMCFKCDADGVSFLFGEGLVIDLDVVGDAGWQGVCGADMVWPLISWDFVEVDGFVFFAGCLWVFPSRLVNGV